MSKRNAERQNAFNQEVSQEEAAAVIYGDGKASTLDTGVVRAKPTPINQIWPDLQQPRRAIPMSVRGAWNGDPDELPKVLEHWHMMAERESGKKLDIAKILNGYDSVDVVDGDSSISGKFGKLLLLGASIKNEGLTNPITIFPNGSQYKVETGERRWLAHHLLTMHLEDKKFSKILAREVKYDPYRQASENNARDGYNAIEMARQIAILIMDARKGLDGVRYDELEDMVFAGECDRKFYAQVANGYIHKIPDGMGDKICNATGLSIHRISQYRRLLAPTEDEALNDQIWIDADSNGWTENYIRETVLPSLKPKDESLTPVKHSPAADGGFTPDNSYSAARSDSTPPSAAQAATPLSDYYDAPPPTPYAQWTPKDSFGRDVYPPKASPFGAAASAEPKRDGGAIDEDLTNKPVRLKDNRVGRISWDGGSKLMFVKDGASVGQEIYRNAIWSILNEEAARVHESKYPISPTAQGASNHSPSPHSDVPKQTNPVKPNGKLVEDRTLYTLLGQAKFMAETLGDSEAANSLNMLASITMADIRKMTHGQSDEDVQALLGLHYNNVIAFTKTFIEKVEMVLNDWAVVDTAERRGE